MSSIQDEYERLPYPYYVHPLSDPARLAVLGRLFGLRPADPRRAFVIELGCGSGSNLLTMAARFPGSRFLGVDFSAPDIASAREIAGEAGLTNIEFRQADLLTWTLPAEKADYIIAYGLFSWAPDEVKDRIFRVCRASLAPQGIGCISYMAYPGCKQPEALRDLLRLRAESRPSAPEKVAAAQAVLGFLDNAYGAIKDQPHAGSLRAEVQRIRAKDPRFLLHDDLGIHRDPCYLIQFATWAAEHGLRYLAESEFQTMLAENLPAELARELLALNLDRLETEQMLDYVVNRAFRCSLLVGPEAAVGERLDASALRELCFGPQLQPEKPARSGESEARFRADTGNTVTLRSVPLVTFLRALAARPGAFTPYGELLDDAQKKAGREFTEAEQARLCEDLLSLYGRRQLDLSATPFAPPATLPEYPRLSPLNAVLARRRGMAVTTTHKAIQLGVPEQQFVALLDGSRTVAELRASPESRALDGKAEALLKGLLRAGCLG